MFQLFYTTRSLHSEALTHSYAKACDGDLKISFLSCLCPLSEGDSSLLAKWKVINRNSFRSPQQELLNVRNHSPEGLHLLSGVTHVN